MHGNQRQGLHGLSYIGGLIDGEGSIMVTRSISGRRLCPTYTPRIKIAMTDIEPLQFVLDETGMGKINREVDRRGNRKVIYQWQVHSLFDCERFARLIFNYLIIKRPQAELMISYCDAFRRQKKCMDGVPEDERSYRQDVYEKMHKLNMCHQPQRLSPEALRREAIV